MRSDGRYDSGTIGWTRCFSHSNIRFDYDHGIYYPTVNGKQEITVEATDETLLHWTINTLNRHGYTCLQTQNAPAGLPHLQVIAPRLYLTKKGNIGHSLRSGSCWKK